MELFFLRGNILDKIKIRNKKEAIENYQVFFEYLINDNKDEKSLIRFIKNHLIALNESIFCVLSSTSTCECQLYDKRNEFIFKIEEKNSIEELCEVGKEIIEYYVFVDLERQICTNSPIVKKALQYIHDNLTEELNLHKIAREIHVSPSHLSTIFNQCVGKSISNYINEMRIEKSKILLKGTYKSLSNIAIESGFNSQSYFCSTFKKFTGVTPKAYRMSLTG